MTHDFKSKRKSVMVITTNSFFGFDQYWGHSNYRQSVVALSSECVVLQVKFKTLFNALDSTSKLVLTELISKHEQKVEEAIRNISEQLELQQQYLKLPALRERGQLLNRSRQQSEVSSSLGRKYHSVEGEENKKKKSRSVESNLTEASRSELLQATFRNLQP